MLNSIRRHPHSDPEDYRCVRCDTPLLRADSICPTCEPQTQRAKTASYLDRAEALEYSAPLPETLPERVDQEESSQRVSTVASKPTDVIYAEPVSHYDGYRQSSQRSNPRLTPNKLKAFQAKLPAFIERLTDDLNQWILGQQQRIEQLPNPEEDWLASPIAMKINWGSWPEVTMGLLWILGGLGLILGTIRLYCLDGFQAIVLFQFSGLVFLATSAYRKLQRLEINQLDRNHRPAHEDTAAVDRLYSPEVTSEE